MYCIISVPKVQKKEKLLHNTITIHQSAQPAILVINESQLTLILLERFERSSIFGGYTT